MARTKHNDRLWDAVERALRDLERRTGKTSTQVLTDAIALEEHLEKRDLNVQQTYTD